MMLPISLIRPALESASPVAGPDPVAHAGRAARTFGHALSSAMHESVDARKESRAHVRHERQPASQDDVQVEHKNAHDTPTADETHGAKRELGGETRTTFVGTPGTGSGSGAPRATGRPTADTAGASEPERLPADRTDESVDRRDAFVAHSLESAVAAPAPLALVARGEATPLAGDTPTPPANEGGPSAAINAPEIVLASDRALDAAEGAARRRAIEGAMARDPLAVRRELDALTPELRARLDRVVDRMEQEYGYTVEVVETTRTQARQDTLYAQGRTAPGDVVTWTRNSKHLAGGAADVVVDGGYDNAVGFERLARVAREEGLRTLWPRDPGHIELPGTAARASVDAGARAVRGGESESRSLTEGVDGAVAPGIPKATRSGVDPAAGRAVRELPVESGNGVHTMPTAPAGGERHTLPFPMPDLSLPSADGALHSLPTDVLLGREATSVP
ncbi:MAG: M15 family metallopeptidase, partial [Gemmatimonadota bacterium]